jgi:hypothetical protein
VTIATAANVAAWLTDLGFIGFGIEPDAWAIAVVIVAALCGVATAISGRGRLTPALALTWGLCWLAFARLAGEPASQSVGIAAVIAACAVIAAAVTSRIVAQRSGDRVVVT